MKAVGKIGWILIIGMFTFVFWQPIGFAAVDVFRTDHYAEQRRETNKYMPNLVPPGYIMEIGWFLTFAISTTGWWFWMEAKADIDPQYDVVNALLLLLHILLKVYFYLIHTTRHSTGASAIIWVAFVLSFSVIVMAGDLATWQFFWWWAIMPFWLSYICFISTGNAIYAIEPLPERSHKPPAVGPGRELFSQQSEP